MDLTIIGALLLVCLAVPVRSLESCYSCDQGWQSQQVCNQSSTERCPAPNTDICVTRVKNDNNVIGVQKRCWNRNACYNNEGGNAASCADGEVPEGDKCDYCCEDRDNCNWDRIDFVPEGGKSTSSTGAPLTKTPPTAPPPTAPPPTAQPPTGPPPGGCVSDCTGFPDGDYQSCEGCDHFVKCSNGYIYYMDCPAGLVWDDILKRCEYKSTTCDGWQPSNCVSDCTDMPDGDYQSCRGCNEFVSCSNGYLHYMPCAEDDLVWDDYKKSCEYMSETCRECSDSCSGLVDDSYHSCKGCSWYKVCEGGVQVDEGQCPLGKKWDDVKKQCSWTSTTCSGPSGPSYCVSDCTGVPDGDYQSCLGCDHFVKCSNEILYYFDCPADLVWDDILKRCEWESDTCNGFTPSDCVSSCSDMPDGDYQSCRNCHEFVSCSNELLYFMPCPEDLVWDDEVKQCEWESTTCRTCTRSCEELPDGSYHSCRGCTWYTVCEGRNMTSEEQCPLGQRWDDKEKWCSWFSQTCFGLACHLTASFWILLLALIIYFYRMT